MVKVADLGLSVDVYSRNYFKNREGDEETETLTKFPSKFTPSSVKICFNCITTQTCSPLPLVCFFFEYDTSHAFKYLD